MTVYLYVYFLIFMKQIYLYIGENIYICEDTKEKVLHYSASGGTNKALWHQETITEVCHCDAVSVKFETMWPVHLQEAYLIFIFMNS